MSWWKKLSGVSEPVVETPAVVPVKEKAKSVRKPKLVTELPKVKRKTPSRKH